MVLLIHATSLSFTLIRIFFFLQLDGSMIIVAESIMGSTRSNDKGEPILQHGHRFRITCFCLSSRIVPFDSRVQDWVHLLCRCGRCKLCNVTVLNDGIDWTSDDNVYWKHDVCRSEALKVILHGNAEFEAYNVTIQVKSDNHQTI